ncbi:MAG: hypothetical protein L0Z73_03285 [Gammaproteobacteria bacterium]|nr:hypothetical protein [Gammaproteobacteria bacterium]
MRICFVSKYYLLTIFILIGPAAQADTLNSNRLSVKTDQPGDPQLESKQAEIHYPVVDTEKIMRIFKAAVDRGELKLFEKQIALSALNPQQVEYIYLIGETKPTIKVYSFLNKPLPHPAMPNLYIGGVTATLDEKGHIIEAVMHSHY